MFRATQLVGTYARAHLSQRIEDAIEHDKQRENGLDGTEGATNDEAQDRPQEETQSHRLLAADPVHEEAADEAAGEVEAVDDSAEPDVLCNCIVRIQCRHDGRAEDTERICLCFLHG